MWHQGLCGQTTYSHSKFIAQPFSFTSDITNLLSDWIPPALSSTRQNWSNKNSETQPLQQKYFLPFDPNKASE